jgi:phosphopantothenoylcysteine decarboxylase/phosphopantothenate--cysteine ligase
MRKKPCLALGVTASIAVYKACELARLCAGAGYDTHVVMTTEAVRLISPQIFRSLTGNPVRHEMFVDESEWSVEHIALADQADLVVIAPATANIMAKLACGICDDFLSCLVCATEAPVLICPAMNDRMYRHKATQENIRRLRSRGYVFCGPRRGMLVCGREGIGCLSSVEDIHAQIRTVLESKSVAT